MNQINDFRNLRNNYSIAHIFNFGIDKTYIENIEKMISKIDKVNVDFKEMDENIRMLIENIRSLNSISENQINLTKELLTNNNFETNDYLKFLFNNFYNENLENIIYQLFEKIFSSEYNIDIENIITNIIDNKKNKKNIFRIIKLLNDSINFDRENLSIFYKYTVMWFDLERPYYEFKRVNEFLKFNNFWEFCFNDIDENKKIIIFETLNFLLNSNNISNKAFELYSFIKKIQNKKELKDDLKLFEEENLQHSRWLCLENEI